MRNIEEALAKDERLRKIITLWRVGSGFPAHIAELNRTRGLLELIMENIGPKATIAETGTYRGVSTETFALTVGKIHTYDIYRDGALNPRLEKYKNIKFTQIDSVKAAGLHKDKSLDLVYLDSAHDKKHVKKEIGAWLPKVKSGGYIAGHDFDFDHEGVKEAVRGTVGEPDKVYQDGSWIKKVK